MYLGMTITLLAWMAHRLVSSKRPTRYSYGDYILDENDYNVKMSDMRISIQRPR